MATDEYKHLTETDNGNGLSESDVMCGVCYELLILPTTLRCGHNFCRPCLANWYLASKKTECPVCRQSYQEKPEVNNLLRTLIEKSFKAEAAERKQKCLTDETKTLLEEYDKAMTPATGQGGTRNIHVNWNRNRNRNAADFCSGILFTFGIVVIVYLVYYWRNIDDGLLIRKNVVQWTTEDVYQWLSDLGTWAEPYKENFLNNTVDGHLLLAINENTLKTVLNVSEPLHQAAILSAIDSLRATGMKLPSTLWEYKAIHPGYALFLLYGIKDYPRLTMLYLYWFDYYNMFLPLVHFTCPEEQEEYFNNLNLYEPLSTSQQIEFSTKMIFLPYFLVGKFTWEFLSIHYWTSRFILANCLALTVIEAAGVRWLMSSGNWRDIKSIVSSHSKGIFGMIVCVIFWPIIPNFICDFFFYVALYFSPYTNCEKLYKILMGRL